MQTFATAQATEGPPFVVGPNRGDDDRFSVIAHGIDTVSYAFRGLGVEDARRGFTGSRLDALSDHIVKPVKRGWTTTLSIPYSETKLALTVTPSGDALVWCEGSLGDVLGQGRGLVGSEQLGSGEAAARAFGRRLGIPLDGCTGTVRRCDLASDVAFDRSGDGFAFLRAARGLVLPRHQARVFTARGNNAVETVAWRNRAGTQLRIYDKSSQRGQNGGSLVRIERQWRPPARKQFSSAHLADLDLSDLYGGPLRGWTLDGLVVAAPVDAYWVLKSRLGRPLRGNRVLTPRIAERMLGTLFTLLAEGDGGFDSARKARERRADLRAVGIEVDEQVSTVIDIGNVLLAAIRPWIRQKESPWSSA